MNISTLARPIPIALLPHTVVLKTPKADGIFKDGEYDEITIFNVRFEEHLHFKQGKTGEAKTKGASVFVDCVNSSPSDIDFEPEQFIIFCGETYKIEAIKKVMAANKIHHYRIEVV